MGSENDQVRGARVASWLATASMAVFGVAGSAVFATLGILFAWVPPRGSVTALLARLWGRSMLAAAGVRVDAEYAPGVEPGRGYVFIANHQSYYDIPAVLASTPGQLRFAAKRSLFKIPVFGWSLAAGGFIPVDRADRSRAREVWAAAGRLLAAGSSVVFFPEGTRSAGGGLGPFLRGGFLVALKTGAPIVPVGIDGARRVMPRGTLRVTPGTIAVRYGAPIDPGEYGLAGKAALIARVRGEVAALAGLDPEPPR
jgi:1-acyl-sn-glycerol-3-phosphate acyltransferase